MADPHMLNAALAYARAGWPVLPLAGKQPGEEKCSCHWRDTCVSPAKHPRTKTGLYDASTLESTIRGWFHGFKVMNIGIRTGVVCDVVDVDLESKAGGNGYESLMYVTQHDPSGDSDADVLAVWPGPVVKTGNGWHLYLRPTGGSNRAHLMPGIDYRGDGGYVVAAPSVHVTGRPYAWLRKGALPIEPTPWLSVLLHQPQCPYVDPARRSKKPCHGESSHRHEPTIQDPEGFAWVSGVDRLARGETI